MNALNGFYGLVREAYGPYFPSSKAKKESFLEKVRDKVEHYKPKMEEVCNVNMGNAHVKDFREFVGDCGEELVQKSLDKYTKENGEEPSRFVRGLTTSSMFTTKILAKPLMYLIANARGVEMKYYNSSIYVPFYYINRFMDIDFQRREKELDQSVVHELSHHLWHVLGGVDPSGFGRDQRVWSEGFATYCADIYFANLYPDDFEVNSERWGIHGRGKEKVEELVEKYGKDIILEIPKRWEEFNILSQ